MTADDAADDPSVRARRAQRARSGRITAFAQRNLKAYAIVAGLALGAMGVWALVHYMPQLVEPEGDLYIHNHAGFKILIGDQEVDVHKCEFDLNGCEGKTGTNYLGGHLHYVDKPRNMLHIEHPASLGNLTLARYFEKGLGFTVTNTSLKLDTRVYDGRLVENNATHTWQLWVQHCVKKPLVWERLMDLPRYVPQQHDRFALVYTDRALAQLEATLETTPTSEHLREAGGGACPIIAGRISFVPSTSATG